MKLRAKILSKYAEQIKAGSKKVDYRQFESIEFEVVETGEVLEFEVLSVDRCTNWGKVVRQHPDVEWKHDDIYKIQLGKRLR